MKWLAAVLLVLGISANLPQASAQMGPPTVGPTLVASFAVPCEIYAGYFGIPAGYTMGMGYFDVYDGGDPWIIKYNGGCMRPATRLAGSMSTNLVVKMLKKGALSGGTTQYTFGLDIKTGQMNDDGSEYYSSVVLNGWTTNGASATVSFDPRQGAGEIYFYLPLQTPVGQDQAFLQFGCRFFSTTANEREWKGFLNNYADYQDGGRTVVTIGGGECSASPSKG